MNKNLRNLGTEPSDQARKWLSLRLGNYGIHKTDEISIYFQTQEILD